MERINFADAEFVEHGDLTAIGLAAQDATDKLWMDAIGYPAHWAAFTVAQKSAQEVTVSAGRYVAGEIVYEHAAPSDLNLQLHIPVAASDQRWVAILLRGEEVTEAAQRTFETSADVDTSIPVEQSTAKTIRRRVNLIVQPGEANPVPVKPAIAATDACIAFVLLTSQGIDTIEPGNDSRVKTLHEVEGRVASIEVNLDSLFLRTETIETQITNLKGAITEIPNPVVIRQMQRDIGATRLKLDLPNEARAYVFDPALMPDQWDMGHVDWLARIAEGVRFGFASTIQSRLEVQAEDDPDVAFKGRRLVPAYDEVTRIANTARDGSLNISQLVHTNTTMVRKEVSKQRTIYGPTVRTCENRANWARYNHDLRVGQTYRVDGETFEVVEQYTFKDWPGHDHFGIRTIQVETYTEPYWEVQTEEIGINGSVYGQSFLVAQPMQMTSLDLSFARVGATGDVHVFIVETSRNGAPRFGKTIAQGVLTHGDITQGWNRVDLPLTYLESGKRYAFLTVTTGAHSLHVSAENKYTGGTRFITTDGAFAQGSIDEDICFRVNAARYRQVRTVVPMVALTLADGMTEIDMVYPSWVPDGCQLGWEIRPQGTADWIELDDGNPEDNALYGLPASVELRMVLAGTADLQPMIELTQYAVSRVSRNRGSMVGVSAEFDFGLSTTEIVTQYTLDGFDPARHSFTPGIMVGGAVVAPVSTVETVDDVEPLRRTFVSTYTVAATTAARMRVEATTDNVVTVPFVQDAFIAAQ